MLKDNSVRLETYPSDNALLPPTIEQKRRATTFCLEVLVKLRVIVFLAEVLDLCKPKPYLLPSSSQVGRSGTAVF